jgi:hypothetical protein
VPIKEDVSLASILGQAGGFSPSEVRLATEAKGAIYREDRKLQAAYDIYNSDFGDFKIVPNRNMVRTREAYLVDGDLAAVAMLRDMKSEELARIGSARNFMIESEWALQLREERGMAAIRDLNP